MLKLQTAPTDEPVTVTDVKAAISFPLADTTRDAFFTSAIAVARRYAEAYTRRAFMTQTWALYLDEFPCGAGYGRGASIVIPLPPLQSVTSVKYYDTSGVQQTLATDKYAVDASSEPGSIQPAYGLIWPMTRDMPNAVEIIFVAGYGDETDDVPEEVKLWISARVGSLNANREDYVVTPGLVSVQPLPFLDGLLLPLKTGFIT